MAKILKNSKTKLQIADKEGKLIENASYSDILRACVNSIADDRGLPIPITIEEMKKRLRILDVLDSSKNSNIILEDADAAKLQELVANHKWLNIEREIVEMVDFVAEMKEYKKAK